MAKETIFLKTGREGEPLPKEGKAAAAITPGQLIKYDSTAGQVIRHATAGGSAAKMFAIEDSLQGKQISDDYAQNSRVQFVHAGPGDEINAILATSQTIAVGDYLESAGNGNLRKASGEESELPSSMIGIALEAVTTTSSVARIKIAIM